MRCLGHKVISNLNLKVIGYKGFAIKYQHGMSLRVLLPSANHPFPRFHECLLKSISNMKNNWCRKETFLIKIHKSTKSIIFCFAYLFTYLCMLENILMNESPKIYTIILNFMNLLYELLTLT
jgi:hypothetical protein